MAVKIRLARRGRKKKAMYDIVIADARAPRDGRFIEKIGTYNPLTVPANIVMNDDKALDWLLKGAQPTETVRAMLSYRGILLRKHLQIGVNKGALTQEQADAKFEKWIDEKQSKIDDQTKTVEQKKADDLKARFEAERKVKEARAEELKKKNQVVTEVEAEAEVEAPAAETPVAEAPATEVPAEEAPATEAPATEAPAEEAPAAEEGESKSPQTPAAE
ncbi:MAG: 30S ribosomal protein S16 [Cyclobacteriaceae bacterium]|nr:30S ribosomal protein S16 [Cyclobacteriaceae bacterium]